VPASQSEPRRNQVSPSALDALGRWSSSPCISDQRQGLAGPGTRQFTECKKNCSLLKRPGSAEAELTDQHPIPRGYQGPKAPPSAGVKISLNVWLPSVRWLLFHAPPFLSLAHPRPLNGAGASPGAIYTRETGSLPSISSYFHNHAAQGRPDHSLCIHPCFDVGRHTYRLLEEFIQLARTGTI
jgi:hypothetical protein